MFKLFLLVVSYASRVDKCITYFIDLMNKVFKDMINKFVLVFIDDILIYSKNEEEHARHLDIILEILRCKVLKEKFSKCYFWEKERKFLRHIISEEGISVGPGKFWLFRIGSN